jgi:integrase
MNFTKEAVEGLKPGPKRYDVHDDGPKAARGLCVTVTPNGAKSYYWVRKADGKTERVRIGSIDDFAPEGARQEATTYNQGLGQGHNPGEARRGRRAEPTVQEVWDAYLAHHKQPSTGHKSIEHDEWRFKRHLAGWGGRKLGSITRAEVVRLHAAITTGSGPVAANRAVALLSSLIGWWGRTIGRELPNPCRGVKRNDEASRERYLLPDEMRRWWAAVLADHDRDTQELAALLVLLGVRRGNLQRARWEQFDLASCAWRIPASEMKAAREHLAPLSAAAIGILTARRVRMGNPTEGLVFPGRRPGSPLGDPRGGLARLAKTAGIADLHPHDLRRSYATWALEAGVDSAVVGYLLAHTDPSVSGIYRRVTFGTALEASDRTCRAILRGAGLEPDDFAKGLPNPTAIRKAEPTGVLAFPSPAEVKS